MDHQYGIAVTNKFSLFLDEDEDPFDVLSRQEEQTKTKKEDGDKKPSKSKQKKTVATPETKAKVIEQPVAKKEEKSVPPKHNERGRGGGSSRDREPREIRDNDGDKRPPRRQGPKENREVRVGDENVPPEFRERPEGSFRRREDREGFGGERGRGRGRSRGRGGRGGDRGGFGGPRGGFGGERKREFDRHSGTDKTGVKPVEKREGGGAHNWGNFKDDIEEQITPSETTEWGNQPEPTTENPENESGENVQPPEEEAQAHEMTLDEWKALQTQNKPKAEFNIRQAGEGEDGSRWSNGREYHKKHEEEDGEEEDDESEEDDEDYRHNRGKHVVTDIRITFNDTPRRGRGRRGTRGGLDRGGSGTGGRGSRGGGSGSLRGVGSKPRESAPRFDDEADFPSLVKSAA